MCKSEHGKHIRPPEDAWKSVDKHGYPTKPVSWDPRCPLAALEYVFQFQHDEDVPKRCYPAWNPAQKNSENRIEKWAHMSSNDVSTPSKMAVDWMRTQGLPRFDTNSGRKSLARWCKMLRVPYKQSVHIHGDVQKFRL